MLFLLSLVIYLALPHAICVCYKSLYVYVSVECLGVEYIRAIGLIVIIDKSCSDFVNVSFLKGFSFCLKVYQLIEGGKEEKKVNVC